MGRWTGIGHRVVEKQVRYVVEADNAKEALRKLWEREGPAVEQLSDLELESEFFTIADVVSVEGD